MKKILAPLCLMAAFVLTMPFILSAQEDLTLKPYAIKVNVTDMSRALSFYKDRLDFTVEKSGTNNSLVLLKPGTGTEKIILKKVSYLLPTTDREAGASFTFQINQYDTSIGNLKAKGLDFTKYQKRKEGVGYAIFLDDPFGTKLSFMHETVVANPKFVEPCIYNFGFNIPDMKEATDFYTKKLGFLVRSERYLPLDLPLSNKDKSFAFMLHYREGTEGIHYNSADNQHVVILFSCSDITKTMQQLKARGVKLVNEKIENTELGRMISFYDPFGYISQVIEIHG